MLPIEDVWTVSSLTNYIKNIIEDDVALYNIWVEGEVTDFKRAYSGHCYFRLKDAYSIIPCVMWRSRAYRLKFDIKDGMTVLLRGNISVYEKGGYYQIVTEEIIPLGVGELFLKFLQLKEKLEKKGYFDPARKKPIPFLPKGIGIATSLKGAGLQDMLKIITSRYPAAKIYISPTVVQGEEAPESIVKSIEILNKYDPVDVIIIGRGGGSYEDLSCFNDERVAEAIYRSKKPIISGVGHETDVTISDMVADVRAETPTASANMVVPSMDELKQVLTQSKNKLVSYLKNALEKKALKMEVLSPKRMEKILNSKIESISQYLDHLWDKIPYLVHQKLEEGRMKLKHAEEKLQALNPKKVLLRGYAIVTDKEGNILKSSKQAYTSEKIDVLFYDGKISATVQEGSKIDKNLLI